VRKSREMLSLAGWKRLLQSVALMPIVHFQRFQAGTQPRLLGEHPHSAVLALPTRRPCESTLLLFDQLSAVLTPGLRSRQEIPPSPLARSLAFLPLNESMPRESSETECDMGPLTGSLRSHVATSHEDDAGGSRCPRPAWSVCELDHPTSLHLLTATSSTLLATTRRSTVVQSTRDSV